jgi:hypothetical protein
MANGRGGRRPGAGRKRKADELELMNLLNTAWPLAERRAAIERLVEISKSGINSIDAIKLLFAYAYGRPVERKEITGADGGALEVTFIDYRAGLAGLEAGSDEDSNTPGED